MFKRNLARRPENARKYSSNATSRGQPTEEPMLTVAAPRTAGGLANAQIAPLHVEHLTINFITAPVTIHHYEAANEGPQQNLESRHRTASVSRAIDQPVRYRNSHSNYGSSQQQIVMDNSASATSSRYYSDNDQRRTNERNPYTGQVGPRRKPTSFTSTSRFPQGAVVKRPQEPRTRQRGESTARLGRKLMQRPDLAPPEVPPSLLTAGDMDRYFEGLSHWLGFFRPGDASSPLKLVLLGDSLTICHYQTGKKAYRIDVLLDQRTRVSKKKRQRKKHWGQDPARMWMEHSQVFRELDGPNRDGTKTATPLFETPKLRNHVYTTATVDRRPIIRKTNVVVYAMVDRHAFQIELYRLELLKIPTEIYAKSNTAIAILRYMIEKKQKLLRHDDCRGLRAIRNKKDVSKSTISAVDDRYYYEYGWCGIEDIR